jgi:hypothetical protein
MERVWEVWRRTWQMPQRKAKTIRTKNYLTALNTMLVTRVVTGYVKVIMSLAGGEF